MKMSYFEFNLMLLRRFLITTTSIEWAGALLRLAAILKDQIKFPGVFIKFSVILW